MITIHSKNRIARTADQWRVPGEYFEPLYNYLIHGFEPGSFWTYVLSNDWMMAIQSSHPGNDLYLLRITTGWIVDQFPRESWGDYDRVQSWIKLEAADRRTILEQNLLIYTQREELELCLKQPEETLHPIF